MTRSNVLPRAVRLDIATAPPAMVAPRAARLLNVLLAGAGLVRMDRVLTGLLLGLITWPPLIVAAFVAWLSPMTLPPWQVLGLTAVGLVGYLTSQIVLARLLARQPARHADYLARTVPALSAAYDQFARGDLLAAQLHLDTVLATDSEHFEANLLRARMLAVQGKFDQACRAYRRCRRLDSAGRWSWEISRELNTLPTA